MKTRIVNVTAENLAEYPQVICFINPKHEFYHKKIEWLDQQFKNGLRIKLLFIEEEKKPVGFIEYVPGEYCWRSVQANGYMFIHCLWTNGKKYQHQGLGAELIAEVERDAKDMHGVAVLTSDKAFMANREIFVKRGYELLEESGKEQLLVKTFDKGPLPHINDWESVLNSYQGLNIIYSKQCPWVARFMEEVKPVLANEHLEPHIIEIKTAKQAQKAPSLYATFNLVYNGKLLADRYISVTRFKNILKKEIKAS
ncbi:MAG: GNAT family N-acetyltransferase [candidate division KSB1 bacterium]|nr:GNAT family N-acetyltransferase [candidate division KSB1 bacterium]